MTPRRSIAPKTAKRTASAALATALCGSLILSSLPASAQPPPPATTPAPTAGPAPTMTAPTEPTEVAVPPSVPPTLPVDAAPPAEAPPAQPLEVPPPPPMAMPMEPPAEAPPPEAKPKLPAYLMWGVGGASLLVGTIFGIVAVSKEKSFKDDPTYDKADAVHTNALVSDIGLGLGAILLVSGTVFYFVEDKDDAPAPQAKRQRDHHPFARLGVSPVVGMKTQGAAVTLKF